MIAHTEDQPRPTPCATFARAGTPTIWGLDARGLHDRAWSARGVQIVRPGMGSVTRRGPRLYLLLGDEDLAIADLRPAADALRRKSIRVVRLALHDPQRENHYSEQLVTDEADRLVASRRRYHTASPAVHEVLLTTDPQLATVWRRRC